MDAFSSDINAIYNAIYRKTVRLLNERLLNETSHWFFVLIKDGKSKVVSENDSVWDYEKDGWEIVWDSAKSKQAGYEFALMRYNAVPEDDEYSPKNMDETKILYRSVSIPELRNIKETGKVLGKGNSFNSFDTRKWVFFTDSITPNLISQGEEIERQATVSLMDPRLQ